MNQFNFDYDSLEVEPTHRIEYRATEEGASVSIPAVYDNDDEAIESAKRNRPDYASVIVVSRYDGIRLVEIHKESATYDVKSLKHAHEIYNAYRLEYGWDGERFRDLYGKEQLALHLLLESEAFYVRNEDTIGLALSELQDAYPDATMDYMMNVYRLNADVVTQIYG